MVYLMAVAGEEEVMALVYIKLCHFSKVGSLHYHIRKPLVLVVQTSNIQINTKPKVYEWDSNQHQLAWEADML